MCIVRRLFAQWSCIDYIFHWYIHLWYTVTELYRLLCDVDYVFPQSVIIDAIKNKSLRYFVYSAANSTLVGLVQAISFVSWPTVYSFGEIWGLHKNQLPIR